MPPLVCPCSLLAPPPTVRFLQSAAEEEKEEIIDGPFDLTVARSASRGQTLSSGEETDELFDAAAAGDQERVVALLAAGADVDQARTATDTPAWAASLNPDGSKMGAVVAALLKATALLVASANGHAPVVKLLLAAGAAVDQTDDDGRTAVFLASLFGVVAVVAMLIAAGANVDLAMKNGATPLYVACEEGHLDVVALLVCAGADLRPMLKGKGFELKRPTGGAYEACVLYMDENFRTFFCASAKDAADAKAIPVEGIIGASAVDGSDVAFRITSLTGAALDLEAPSPKLRDALVLGLNKLFALETEAAAERDRHFKSIGFFPSDVLRTPAHINPAIFASFMRWKCKTTEAARGTQFWADSTDSEGGTFRDANGVLIADEAVLRMEKDLKAAAEAEDADFKVANLHGMAVRLDFLLALTFMLDLWDWKTWEVRVFTLAPVGRSPPPPISLGVALLLFKISRAPLSGGEVPGEAGHRGPRPLPLRRPALCQALHGARHGVPVALLGRPVGRPRRGGVRGGERRPLRVDRHLRGERAAGPPLGCVWAPRCLWSVDVPTTPPLCAFDTTVALIEPPPFRRALSFLALLHGAAGSFFARCASGLATAPTSTSGECCGCATPPSSPWPPRRARCRKGFCRMASTARRAMARLMLTRRAPSTPR